GVISAAALKAVGGGMQGKLWPRNDEEKQQLVDSGYDLDRVLTTDDLVSGQDVFVAATGVTTGALLRGVRYLPNGAITDSIVMRSRSGTVRRIEASHALDKLESFTGGDVGGVPGTDADRQIVVVRARALRRPRLRALRVHTGQERPQRLLRRLREGLAGLLRERDAASGHRHQALADRHDQAPRRPPPDHLRRAAALLLRR